MDGTATVVEIAAVGRVQAMNDKNDTVVFFVSEGQVTDAGN